MTTTIDGAPVPSEPGIARVRSDHEDHKARLAKAEADAGWWRGVVTDERFRTVLERLELEGETMLEEMIEADKPKDILRLQADIRARRRLAELFNAGGVESSVSRLRQELADFESANVLFAQQEKDREARADASPADDDAPGAEPVRTYEERAHALGFDLETGDVTEGDPAYVLWPHGSVGADEGAPWGVRDGHALVRWLSLREELGRRGFAIERPATNGGLCVVRADNRTEVFSTNAEDAVGEEDVARWLEALGPTLKEAMATLGGVLEARGYSPVAVTEGRVQVVDRDGGVLFTGDPSAVWAWVNELDTSKEAADTGTSPRAKRGRKKKGAAA